MSVVTADAGFFAGPLVTEAAAGLFFAPEVEDLAEGLVFLSSKACIATLSYSSELTLSSGFSASLIARTLLDDKDAKLSELLDAANNLEEPVNVKLSLVGLGLGLTTPADKASVGGAGRASLRGWTPTVKDGAVAAGAPPKD